MRHKTFSRPLSGSRTVTVRSPPGPSRGRSTRFAAAMARVRRPVPFRTRKLRPCTAMVLHPRGCGRVARRRFHTIRFPPVEPPRAPGGFLFFPRLHRIPSFRHSYLLIFIFIYIFIHIHSFIFIHIHSFPPYPSIRPAGGAPGARTETEGHRPRRTRRVARRALHAPARAPARGAGSPSGPGRARWTARRARTGRGERGHTGPAAGRTGRETGKATGRRP